MDELLARTRKRDRKRDEKAAAPAQPQPAEPQS